MNKPALAASATDFPPEIAAHAIGLCPVFPCVCAPSKNCFWSEESVSSTRSLGLGESGARVGGAVGFHQARAIHGGVYLRRRQRGVTKQFLDCTEIAAAAEEVGGEGMAQGVRR